MLTPPGLWECSANGNTLSCYFLRVFRVFRVSVVNIGFFFVSFVGFVVKNWIYPQPPGVAW